MVALQLLLTLLYATSTMQCSAQTVPLALAR